jgi:hypothetical protein
MGLAKKISSPPPIADLYEADYSRWLFENARMLREGRFSEADIENIAEELEDMGRSEKRAVGSHIAVILTHLLEWQFQPDQRSSRWRGSIYNARTSVDDPLSESPSLRNRVPELVTDRYRIARNNAIIEAGLAEDTFPLDCPYNPEQVLDPDFWPESAD